MFSGSLASRNTDIWRETSKKGFPTSILHFSDTAYFPKSVLLLPGLPYSSSATCPTISLYGLFHAYAKSCPRQEATIMRVPNPDQIPCIITSLQKLCSMATFQSHLIAKLAVEKDGQLSSADAGIYGGMNKPTLATSIFLGWLIHPTWKGLLRKKMAAF